ncbi:hypothetical protein [Streptomyces sp. NPDC048560]|uniref:hypothetical protein n=1 Tax=Streptomyces sp. NPDC048560 TaxID=3155488 RepID=UPI0034420AE3
MTEDAPGWVAKATVARPGPSFVVADSADAEVADGAGFGNVTPVEVSRIVGGITDGLASGIDPDESA